jgi:hypothetical protein
MKARKPKVRKTTMKALADWANRTLKPESEDRLYEFGNGTKAKKAGKGAYTTQP